MVGLSVALCALIGAVVGPASARALAIKVERCETVRVSGQSWGVYVETGTFPCAAAGAVLAAVASGKGKDVDAGPADEYWLYQGWVCPYNQMGETVCQSGDKPVNNPKQVIVARDCKLGGGQDGCPTWAKLT